LSAEATATGSTVIIASHDTDRAIALASRVYIVAGGDDHRDEDEDQRARPCFVMPRSSRGKDLRIERRVAASRRSRSRRSPSSC